MSEARAAAVETGRVIVGGGGANGGCEPCVRGFTLVIIIRPENI